MISLCSRVKFEFKPVSHSPGGTRRKTMVKQFISQHNQLTSEVLDVEFHNLKKVSPVEAYLKFHGCNLPRHVHKHGPLHTLGYISQHCIFSFFTLNAWTQPRAAEVEAILSSESHDGKDIRLTFRLHAMLCSMLREEPCRAVQRVWRSPSSLWMLSGDATSEGNFGSMIWAERWPMGRPCPPPYPARWGIAAAVVA